MAIPPVRPLYSLIIAVHRDCQDREHSHPNIGDIKVEWIDFTREKQVDRPPSPALSSSHMKAPTNNNNKSGRHVPGSASASGRSTPNNSGGRSSSTPSTLSLQPLLGHFPGPNPLDSSTASGFTAVGRGVIHLFKHAPPPTLIASLDAHPVGESSSGSPLPSEWAGERAEGEDGSLVAILAVPAWMRPADFVEFIGGWTTCLEGVRMIREATTPNRSIVLLKFRDPLQASDFMVIFTGRPFSTLDARETCHPIRIHHLVLHHVESSTPTPIPAFPPSTYASRARDLPALLRDVPQNSIYELPTCPVCLERLDSTVTGLVTLPCAHTFDCDCLRKWGDSRCPVCRVSHLLLQSTSHTVSDCERDRATRVTQCAICGKTSNNWICVVCGVVGCGRYEPGKGHARRHWEESGHVLAMELETQRVWDYNGDNYVHRLIQSRTDGKLVELPSASSLISTTSRPLPLGSTSTTPPRSSYPCSASASPHSPQRTLAANSDAGPSNNDLEKMSTIESITLEYSYLLSSQLESMRQHYESRALADKGRLSSLRDAEARAEAAESARKEAEAARLKAERRAKKASELTLSLQASLSAERAMSEGLSARICKLREQAELSDKTRREKEDEVKGLEEMVKDLMFTLEAGRKIQEAGGVEAGEGGRLLVVPSNDKGMKKKK